MKIEQKLAFNNLKRNKNRTLYTFISIVLCTVLVLTTMILIFSIKNGITESIENSNSDYYFIINDLSIDDFNLIKNKEYIEKIYIETEEENFRELETNEIVENTGNTIKVYLKYDDVKKTYKYSSDIIQTLDFSYALATMNCEFNEDVLTVYGLMGGNLQQDGLYYVNSLNFSYLIDVMIVIVILFFSILSITIIYNAFLITINERKKEYAVLNSVGSTRNQILKMILLEATILGIFGIIIGFVISYFCSNIILSVLNNILVATIYNFNLVMNIKYMILAIIIVIFNIYISAIIPGIKISNTSIIQDIRNNKQVKYKNKNFHFEKLFTIEANLARKNLKRNKSKYAVVTFLLVICMVSFISVSTYINYEERTADLVSEYDVDAKIWIDNDDIDYEAIFEKYEEISGDKIEYIEYKEKDTMATVLPDGAWKADEIVWEGNDDIEGWLIRLNILGLDDNSYEEYIKELGGSYGDYIVTNTAFSMEFDEDDNVTYHYYTLFENNDIKIYILSDILDENYTFVEYEVIDDETLTGDCILIDEEYLENFKETANFLWYEGCLNIFVNMDTFEKLSSKIDEYDDSTNDTSMRTVKVNCENIISFSNYMDNLEEVENEDIFIDYYTLENQEKLIYLNTIQLILEIVIIAIILIAVVSTMNILNASFSERKQEFEILNSIGATKGNIDKMLIFENLHMLIKSMVISVIISIPIIYAIIKYIENLIVLNKLYIPFGKIILFFLGLIAIFVIITLYSTKYIKDERKV